MLNIPAWPWSNSTPCASGRVGTAITPALLLLLNWSTALQFVLRVRSQSLELLIALNFLGEGLVSTPDCYDAVVSRKKCTKTLRAICSLRLWRKMCAGFDPDTLILCMNKDSRTITHVFWNTIKSFCLLKQCEKTFTSVRLTCPHSWTTVTHSVYWGITPMEM